MGTRISSWYNCTTRHDHDVNLNKHSITLQRITKGGLSQNMNVRKRGVSLNVNFKMRTCSIKWKILDVQHTAMLWMWQLRGSALSLCQYPPPRGAYCRSMAASLTQAAPHPTPTQLLVLLLLRSKVTSIGSVLFTSYVSLRVRPVTFPFGALFCSTYNCYVENMPMLHVLNIHLLWSLCYLYVECIAASG